MLPANPMSLSLPLRINLISLVFASLVASVLTALGGWFLHHQQNESAVIRARLAAEELSARAQKLLDLQLSFGDFIGFNEQCAAVIRGDAQLRQAAAFDAERKLRFHSGTQGLAWPEDAGIPEGSNALVVPSPGGPLVILAFAPGRAGSAGYAVVAVDGSEVTQATLRSVSWLVASAMVLFVLGLLIQQGIFWRTVGRPLASLVRTADNIQPDNLAEGLPTIDAEHSDDDIGRLYSAFSRLMRRLMDARRELLKQNEALEQAVQIRTMQLELLNSELERDIERRKELEEELRVQATTDTLTGLHNRAHILPHARSMLQRAQREHRAIGLLMFDFDGFKQINDTHGHGVGDEVLRIMAQRLQRTCRSGDALARLGGDEFLLAFDNAADDTEVEGFARRLLATFDEPIAISGLSLRVGASIGIALYPEHAGTFDSLLARADQAMYAAKQDGGGYRFAQAGASGLVPA
jgi:diguanylate cyclase (GGDEF)-like protein